jgi:FkbM family methyltransferase
MSDVIAPQSTSREVVHQAGPSENEPKKLAGVAGRLGTKTPQPRPRSVSYRLRALLQKEDIRRHPLQGIFRRVAWQLHWKVSNEPWLVYAHGGLPYLLPHGGAAALIYFQGASEPELANFVRKFLKPGMVFADVGAHLGEYTILGASMVQSAGRVHAFEARPDTFEILARNIQLNAVRNVVAQACGVWKDEGFCEFEKTTDPSVSALRPNAAAGDGRSLVRVETISLDHYFSDSALGKPALIKIDVEGAELQVLQGARSMLSSPRAPVVIVEYGPANTAAFGYRAEEVCDFLKELGYMIYQLNGDRLERIQYPPVLEHANDTCNPIATKTEPFRDAEDVK